MVKVQPEVINEETTTTQTVDSTEPLWCENGGTLENGRCRCPIQYGGTTCQRLIRDCSEPYENGYRGQVVSLLILPAGTVTPFWILCVARLGWPELRAPAEQQVVLQHELVNSKDRNRNQFLRNQRV
ncbi:hypothetical protein C0Q70_17796 [Pomacea canaliculata]|uniref:EGF-like domain-containing protein n=1 Tax=Pomacea canaliculata TaxID=400727 RepID=A0A2T7NLE8_POMCA|nr:hypothetical protein C0Q70_17796 [Pomacea canaliculata]